MEWKTIIYLILVSILGMSIGYIELLNKYSKPSFIFKCKYSWGYIILNGIVSFVAIFILANIKNKTSINQLNVMDVVVAGTSAMVILRSSLLDYKIQGKKINIGLAIIPQIIFEGLDKTYDISLAKDKLERIPKIMENVDYLKAKTELTSLCINSREALNEEDIKVINRELEALTNSNNFSNKNKSIQLGQILSKYFSEDFLEQAVTTLGNDIQCKSDESDEIEKEKSIDFWLEKVSSKNKNHGK